MKAIKINGFSPIKSYQRLVINTSKVFDWITDHKLFILFWAVALTYFFSTDFRDFLRGLL